ncbi:tetratricopeptide repeat-containing sensor histidine kinase [Spirosoma areae]
MKKDNEAIVYAEKARNLFSEIGLNTPAAFALLLKPIFLEEAGKINEAKESNTIANAAIEKINNPKEKALLIYHVSLRYTYQSKSNLAIEYALRANNELEKTDEKNLRILVFENLGLNFAFLSMSTKAVDYYKKAVSLRDQVQDYEDAIRIYFNLGFELVALKKYNEAKQFFLKAKNLSDKSTNQLMQRGDLFRYTDAMGQILLGQGQYTDALTTFYQAQKISIESLGEKDGNGYVNLYIAQCHQKIGNLKESRDYGEKSYKSALNYGDQGLLKKICLLLAEVYEELGQPLTAYTYLKKYRTIVKEKEEQDIVSLSANLEVEGIIQKSEQEKALLEKEKLLKENENQNQRWWLFSIAAALFSTIVVTSILYRNNQHKLKANIVLLRQKEEIDNQRNKAEKALDELKATQNQLVQREKMASLGELTAGIAHEIQNPLNFVNNFSEVSTELVTELEEEQQKPDRDAGLEAELLGDLKQNLQKITLHGQRASSIVKGMLEHSRTSTGECQPTDLNALVDEYLRLAYQGFRRSGVPAKDKSFNCDLKTDFDANLGEIDVVPQEIGRVLLNLFNNAFYAVQQKQKTALADYQPTVTVGTRFIGQQVDPSNRPERAISPTPSNGLAHRTAGLEYVEISVRDNGTGIPESVKTKIFQPFFTTKPTGEGTGLGLSLSYDILTKGHGGTLTVESKPGEFTEFVVCLPLTQLAS